MKNLIAQLDESFNLLENKGNIGEFVAALLEGRQNTDIDYSPAELEAISNFVSRKLKQDEVGFEAQIF